MSIIINNGLSYGYIAVYCLHVHRKFTTNFIEGSLCISLCIIFEPSDIIIAVLFSASMLCDWFRTRTCTFVHVFRITSTHAWLWFVQTAQCLFWICSVKYIYIYIQVIVWTFYRLSKYSMSSSFNGNNDCKVYVGNLPSDIRARDLDDLFYKYGKVVEVDLHNRRGQPFAFVEFEDPRYTSCYPLVYPTFEWPFHTSLPSQRCRRCYPRARWLCVWWLSNQSRVS